METLAAEFGVDASLLIIFAAISIVVTISMVAAIMLIVIYVEKQANKGSIQLDPLAAETVVNLSEAGSYVLDLNRGRAFRRANPLFAANIHIEIIQASTGTPIELIHGRDFDRTSFISRIPNVTSRTGTRITHRTGFTRVTLPMGYFDISEAGEYIIKNASDNYFKPTDKIIIRKSLRS